MVRDLALAEDLAHDALVAALEQWPAEGLPRNPGAWLMAAAKHRAIDQLRRRTRLVRKHEELARDLEAGRARPRADLDGAMDDDIGDDLVAADLHGLPSGAVHRGARRADAAPARRAHHRRDRARFSRPRADHRSAHRPREEDAGQGERALRGASRRGAARAAGLGARRASISCSTRATRRRRARIGCGHRCATRPCVWAVPWRSWRPGRPRCTAWWH